MKIHLKGVLLYLGVYVFSTIMVSLYGLEAYIITILSVLITWGLINDNNHK